MGRVLNRSELTAAEQRQIERIQFAPLPEAHQKWYEGVRKVIADSFTNEGSAMSKLENKSYLKKADFTLSWGDMATICYPVLNPADPTQRDLSQPDISRSVTESYIRLFCMYVNQVRMNARNEQLDEEPVRRGPKSEMDNRPSCAIILDREIDLISPDYLFTPYLVEELHYGLMGFAPKQQFIFLIDSLSMGHYFPVNKLYSILLNVLPGFEEDEKKKQGRSIWNVFGQWSKRKATTDGSPNCCQQKDTFNCGTFTMTNAFCLAFGFDLLCYRQEDLNYGKRPTIAAEFNNDGFSGDFGYDMFDLPTGPEDRIGRPQPVKEDPPVSPGVGEVVHGFDNPPKRKYQAPASFGEGYRTKIRSAAEVLVYEQTLPENLPEPRTPDPYPPQFESKVFEQAGFIYETPESINYNPKREYSLKELKDACQRFPLEGWEEWCNEPREIFTKWMLNEMGAFMSLARDDPLKLMEGLAPGFDKWKAEQDAKVIRRQSPRKWKAEQDAKVIRRQSPRKCKKARFS